MEATIERLCCELHHIQKLSLIQPIRFFSHTACTKGMCVFVCALNYESTINYWSNKFELMERKLICLGLLLKVSMFLKRVAFVASRSECVCHENHTQRKDVNAEGVIVVFERIVMTASHLMTNTGVCNKSRGCIVRQRWDMSCVPELEKSDLQWYSMLVQRCCSFENTYLASSDPAETSVRHRLMLLRFYNLAAMFGLRLLCALSPCFRLLSFPRSRQTDIHMIRWNSDPNAPQRASMTVAFFKPSVGQIMNLAHALGPCVCRHTRVCSRVTFIMRTTTHSRNQWIFNLDTL